MAKVADSPNEGVDAVPADDNIAAWAHEISVASGATDAEIPGDDDKLEKPAAKVDDKPTEQDATQATEGRKVLKAKDGIHEIPYSRHEEVMAARDKAEADRKDAEARATELARQLEEAKAQMEALKTGETKTAEGAKTDTPDQLDARIKKLREGAESLRDEAPWLADQQLETVAVLEELQADRRAAKARAEKAEQDQADRAKQQQEEQAKTVQQTVDAAIAAVPALAAWQKDADRPALFAEAIRIDNKLKDTPEWNGKPLTDRFNEVVKQMTTLYGESILPAGSGSTTPASKETPTPAKKLPDANTPSAGVHSLTDLPGGAPTAQNPLEAADKATPTALAKSLEKLSPEEVIRWATS